MIRWLPLLLWILTVGGGAAAEWHVDNVVGSDGNSGSPDSPFRTAQRAVNQAQAGDSIHLSPAGALYRQQISIRGKTNIVIQGNGVTLTGADPLPAEDWEDLGNGLKRTKLKRTWADRHLLIRHGKAVRMGRSPSIRKAFPQPAALVADEFSWELADMENGWLYVRGSTVGLEWSVRAAGVATSGPSRDVTIRNLNCRHALNDGFNIHGDCRGLKCYDISGYENFDEGFSAHDTCTAWVTRGSFWGNDNAVADVNHADSYYEDCSFRDSLSTEVLFSGGKHRLVNCRITARGKTAFSLSVGSHPKIEGKSLGRCEVIGCRIESADKVPRLLRISAECSARIENCELLRINVSNRGDLKVNDSQLDGSPWLVRSEAR